MFVCNLKDHLGPFLYVDYFLFLSKATDPRRPRPPTSERTVITSPVSGSFSDAVEVVFFSAAFVSVALTVAGSIVGKAAALTLSPLTVSKAGNVAVTPVPLAVSTAPSLVGRSVVTPASVHDIKVVYELLEGCKQSVILGDLGYLSSELKKDLEQEGYHLWTPFRQNMAGAEEHNDWKVMAMRRTEEIFLNLL